MGPLPAYCMGLLLPCERQSVEPMAAIAAPTRVSAQHQSLLHFVSSPNTHSVGVARQYCGQLGKRDNCQIAVSLSLAYRSYLPKEWVDEGEPRRKVGAPGDLVFKARLEIALE